MIRLRLFVNLIMAIILCKGIDKLVKMCYN